MDHCWFCQLRWLHFGARRGLGHTACARYPVTAWGVRPLRLASWLVCALCCLAGPLGPRAYLENIFTTFNDGCLGLCIEEGRSEVR